MARRSGSAGVRERVVAARERQERRLGLGRCNADMTLAELRDATSLTREARRTLAQGHAQLRLSGRGHDRVLRVSRTIADLEGWTPSPTSTSLAPSACGAGGANDRERLAARARRRGLPGAAAGPRRATGPLARDRRRGPGQRDRQEHGGDHRRLAAPELVRVEVAEQLGYLLAGAGLVVVSGMALGIDAAAHRGALDAGGSTIAVLGSGPDVVYPRSERRLYERITSTGAVVSEMPPGTVPGPGCFPKRNRIMAALGTMTLVVEAAQPSGSLITAEQAAKLGREVGAVPGRVTSRVARGTNALLAEGAAVIRDAQDVLDRMVGVGSPDGAPRRAGARRGAGPVS